MTPQPAVLAEGLRKRFGDVHALAGVDLEVVPGTVTGLLGPNGAGKTTTVRILTTLLRPDAGHARVAGLDVVRQAAAVRRVIGLAGQASAVDERLTGTENLVMVGHLHHLRRAETRHRAVELLRRFGLQEAGDRTVRTYSGGMRRRLDLAVSLISRPQVLFLDEPSTGLDPRGRQELWQTIRDLAADGTTVLLTTQYLEEADQLADHIVVIDAGRVIAHGTPSQLKTQAGADRLQVGLAAPATAAQAATVVAELGSGPPQLDPAAGIITLPLPLPVAGSDGVAVVAEVVRRLDTAGLTLSDLAVRRPTLDEVFLTLTGHPAQPDPDQDQARAAQSTATRNPA